MKYKYLAALLVSSFVFSNIQAQVFNFDDNSLSDTTGQVTLVPLNIFGSGQLPFSELCLLRNRRINSVEISPCM